MPNLEQATLHVRNLLQALGLEEIDPEIQQTPQRFAQLLMELTASTHHAPPRLSTFDFFSSTGSPSSQHASSPLLLIQNISFSSLCIHHLVPFFGTVNLVIIPDQLFAGFGAFSDLVTWASKQLQVQERFTETIASILEEQLQPQALLVHTSARHMCVEMRGHRQQNHFDVVSWRGIFTDLNTSRGAALRREALLLLHPS